ncbi:MAG: type II toxin-antitoxin system RelE/ParE family toxin [Chitinophagales bacterium]
MTEAREFLLQLDEKSRDKIIFNIDKAKVKNDNELFKKLKGEIWEFRTLFNKTDFRIFSLWDKEDKQQTLVLATHGIIKKTGKTPEKEIEKAEQFRLKYFELKNMKKWQQKNKELEMFSFDQIKDEFIGEIGTEKKTQYEQELQLEVLGEKIRKVRLERSLTQEELGKLVGVQRAQISKLENNTTNVTMETILKVFGALKAKVNFNVELMNNRIQIA